MPTSANKDIVESKYSKYGENDMIIEGFVSDHPHETEKVESTNSSHKHTISTTEDGHEQEMDCWDIEQDKNEYIELVPKPIPNFLKDNTIGTYIGIGFLAFIIVFLAYIIGSYVLNKFNTENSVNVPVLK